MENDRLTEPRERKEWREMNTTEIDRFACALKVMDETTTKEGRECYGDTFWAFADLVNLHACAASDPRGDQGHRSPSFMLFHKSFVRTFEMAILSIDPNIKAIPWWNMPLDSAPVLNLDGTVNVSAGKYYCPPTPSNGDFGAPEDDPSKANPGCDHSKYIWSDTYFGKQLGSGPNFEVTGGRWAYRKLHRYGDFDHEYWKHYQYNGTEGRVNVTNECVVSKWFSPRSPIVGDLRKQKEFDGNLDQNCVRCCDAYQDGKDENCKCNQPKDYVDVYMRGPTLDTATCSPYVTRNPNGRGVGTPGRNGRSQQDSLLRYTQHDFDACANSNNTRNWIEWQNCQEENMFGSLEGVYCPADKETCTQQELKKVFALHSSAHDKTLGEIGDVTTSPSDPALFFSYHAYIDKNFMVWQKSMMDTGRMTDPGTQDLGAHDRSEEMDVQTRPSDPTNKNYFGYPQNVNVSDLNANMDELSKVQFIKNMVEASVERMQLRSWVVPVTWENFDLMLWQDLKGRKDETQWVPEKFETKSPSKAEQWHEAATMNNTDAKAIYQVLAGADPNDLKVYDAETVTEDLLGPACSSLTNAGSGDYFVEVKSGKHYFNPTFSKMCNQPTFPSPQPGSLTHKLTQGARTYSTSGPFMYLSMYAPTDFFDRGNRADPNLPWVPGTLLTDIALGGLPFRNLFPTNDGGVYGYSNQEIIELSMPCLHGRAPNNKDKPCSPYYYSKGE